MYCRHCGAQVHDEKFCRFCGAKVADDAAPPQQPQQAAYVPPVYNVPPPKAPQMSVGSWMVTIFLSIIPLVGLICLIVWALGDSEDPRKNWAIANLLWMVIFYVLAIVFVVFFVGMAARTGTT